MPRWYWWHLRSVHSPDGEVRELLLLDASPAARPPHGIKVLLVVDAVDVLYEVSRNELRPLSCSGILDTCKGCALLLSVIVSLCMHWHYVLCSIQIECNELCLVPTHIA